MAVRCRGRLTLYEARGKFQMSVVDDRADGRGRAGAGVRAAQAAAGRRGAVRSGAQAAAAVPAPAHRRRDLGVGRRHPRHRPRRAPARSRCPILLAPTPVQGEGAALAHRRGDPPAGGGRRRRRHHRRARRRLAGGSVGVQRGAGGARHRRLPRAGDLRGRPRDRLHHRRLRRRPARADAVGRRRARGPGARRSRGGARAAAAPRRPRAGRGGAPRAPRAGAGARRGSAIRAGCSTSGGSGWTSRSSAGGACSRAGWPRRAPSCARVETRLYRAHPHRRIAEQRSALAAMRHRLEAALRPALVRRRHAIEAARGKLEALSPMRVLERGFSLTQRADGHVVTSAADVQPGERITRARCTTAASTRPSTRTTQGRQMIRAAVLGADVSKSRSPAIHNAAFRALGVDGEYVALSRRRRGSSARWSPTCAPQGYRYLNVTIPHKAGRRAPGDSARAPRCACRARRTRCCSQPRRRARREHRRRRPARRARRSRRRRRAARVVVMAGAGGAAAGALEALTRAGRAASASSRAGPPSRARCARACPRAAAREVTVAAWNGDALARRARGRRRCWSPRSPPPPGPTRDRAPASTRSPATPPCSRWPTARRRRSRIAARAHGAPLRRRPGHARPPGRARHRAGARQGPAPRAIVRSRPRLSMATEPPANPYEPSAALAARGRRTGGQGARRAQQAVAARPPIALLLLAHPLERRGSTSCADRVASPPGRRPACSPGAHDDRVGARAVPQLSMSRCLAVMADRRCGRRSRHRIRAGRRRAARRRAAPGVGALAIIVVAATGGGIAVKTSSSRRSRSRRAR